MKQALWILGAGLLSLVVGCSGSDGEREASSSTITWYKDVQPIMERTCQRCHYAEGPAPTDFSSYETTAPYAVLIGNYVSHGEMPPPAADPACRDYIDAERRFLSGDEKALLAAWAESGAPKGSPGQAPAPKIYTNVLPDPDMELRIAQPYKPVFDDSGNNYACFVINTDRADSFYVNAFQAMIDQVEMVHHVVMYVDLNGNARDVYGDKPFDCLSASSDDTLDSVWGDWMTFAAWGPGGPPIELGEGMGMKIAPKQDIVLQIHYFRSSPNVEGISDQSGIALRTLESVDRQVIQSMIGPWDFVIPAGDEAYTYQDAYPFRAPAELEIIGVFPHMHVLGAAYDSWIQHKNGEKECLVRSDAYSFHNQETYMFKEPVSFKGGDTFFTSCTWNNSPSNPDIIYNPPVDVYPGEGTDNEMCLFITYFAEAG